MLLLMLLVSLSDDDSSCLLAHTGRRRAARARWRPSEDSPPSPPPAALNQTSQQTVIHRPYLPLRGQLLPALRVPDGGVVRGEVRVRELQLSAVGAGTAASALRLDVLQTLAGVGVHLVAVQEDLALETLAQELRVGGGGPVGFWVCGREVALVDGSGTADAAQCFGGGDVVLYTSAVELAPFPSVMQGAGRGRLLEGRYWGRHGHEIHHPRNEGILTPRT